MTSGLSPSGYVGPELNGEPITSMSPVGSLSGTGTSGGISGYTLNFVGTANTAVDIPGQTLAVGQGIGQAGITGTFEITGGSGTVNVSFMSAFNGALSTFTDNYGQSAYSDTKLSLNVGGNTVLFNESSYNVLSSQQGGRPFNTMIENTIPLNFNQLYTFTLSDQAEVMVSNVPEPTTGVLLVGGLVGLCILRVLRPGVRT